MVTLSFTHGSGQVERIVTDDPQLLGAWLKHTVSNMTPDERMIQGSWYVEGWELRG